MGEDALSQVPQERLTDPIHHHDLGPLEEAHRHRDDRVDESRDNDHPAVEVVGGQTMVDRVAADERAGDGRPREAYEDAARGDQSLLVGLHHSPGPPDDAADVARIDAVIVLDGALGPPGAASHAAHQPPTSSKSPRCSSARAASIVAAWSRTSW